MNSIVCHPRVANTPYPAAARAMIMWHLAGIFEALSATPSHPSYPLVQGVPATGGQRLTSTTAPAQAALVTLR